MFMARSDYDMGVNTFSPEGRLFQIEYAMEAINMGSTALGIKAVDGVVLIVEKRSPSKLIEPQSVEKVFEIDAHLACAMSGLIADSKTLVEKARLEAQSHWFTYDEKMRVESVTQSVSNLALAFSDDSVSNPMSRPFGVALLFAGVDDTGPQLYHMDPSGSFTRYHARAIGGGHLAAQQALQEQYFPTITLAEALKKGMGIIKQVTDEAITGTNVEVCTVGMDGKLKMLTAAEIEQQLKDL